LVAGVGAAACLAFRQGTDGLLLGVAGAAWLLGHVIADLGQMAGRLSSYFSGYSESLTADTTTVGVVELVGMVLLLAALGVIAGRPLVSLVATVVGRAKGRGTGAAAPRVGIAALRDPGQGSSHGAFSAVGLSDDPPSDPERFRPPR
jgi:hypothetical protein